MGNEIYFAHPFILKKPRNERHNRLSSKYVPKGISMENYSAEQILWYAGEMNGLPRKHLEYATPEELFEKFLNHVYLVAKESL
jgi:IS30 family transposase